MKSPPIEQKEQIRKRKRIIPLLFVFLQLHAGGNLCNQLVPIKDLGQEEGGPSLVQ